LLSSKIRDRLYLKIDISEKTLQYNININVIQSEANSEENAITLTIFISLKRLISKFKWLDYFHLN